MEIEDFGNLIDACKEFDISIEISKYGIKMTKYGYRHNKDLRYSKIYDYKDFYDLNITIGKLVQLFAVEANDKLREEDYKMWEMCTGVDKCSVNIIKEIYGGKE